MPILKSVLTMAVLFTTGVLHAATPFTISGDKVAAIFASEKVWRKLGGAIENIRVEKYIGKATRFSVQTTEYLPIKKGGYTAGTRRTTCFLLVDVENKGDEIVPKFEVTTMDTSACPAATER